MAFLLALCQLGFMKECKRKDVFHSSCMYMSTLLCIIPTCFRLRFDFVSSDLSWSTKVGGCLWSMEIVRLCKGQQGWACLVPMAIVEFFVVFCLLSFFVDRSGFMFISLKSEVVSFIFEDAKNEGFEMVHWGALVVWNSEKAPQKYWCHYFRGVFLLDILSVKASSSGWWIVQPHMVIAGENGTCYRL